MSEATPTLPETADPGSDFSRVRVLRFRLRQTVIWWSQTTAARPLSACLALAGIVLRRLGFRRRGLSLLLAGRRLARNGWADAAIREVVAREQEGAGELSAMLGAPARDWIKSCAGRVLVLKVPRLADGQVLEKGALVIKFTETFGPVFQGLDVHRLARYFRIILEPSWVGFSLPAILAWTRLSPEKVVVMAPYQPDYDLLRAMDSNLVPVTVGPADWVNPTRFRKLEGVDKIYDAIYVANYNPMKRVDRYLRAVVRVSRNRPGYRAALLCAGVGKGEFGAVTRETIAWAKTKANLDFLKGGSQDKLNELFNRSKVNVLLSLREGMNKGLAEGLFAGTPALLLVESACGNHRHINPETGRVVPDRELEEALGWFADHHAEFQPHRWAQANISPAASTDRLSRDLRLLEVDEGRGWTSDLWVKANQPEMKYLDPRNEHWYTERTRLLEAFASDSGEQGIRGYLDHLHESGANG
jgi:glycosyltransferase involved in cell wall biosynthesis